MQSPRRSSGLIAILLVTALLAGVSGWFVLEMDPGGTTGWWYVAIAIVTAAALIVARFGGDAAPRTVVGLTLLATAIPVLHWFIVERIYSGFTIILGFLCAIALALAVRAARRGTRPSGPA